MITYNIFCDGSCINNGTEEAEGGWAIVVTSEDSLTIKSEHSGKIREGKQTNNRSEMEGMYRSLLWIDKNSKEFETYVIYADSSTVIDGITGDAGRNANRDIWTGIEKLMRKLRKPNKNGIRKITSVEQIEAHMTTSEDPRHKMNCYADKLAKRAAQSLLLEPVGLEDI